MMHPPPWGKSTCDNLPHNKSKSGCPNKTLGVSQIAFDHYFFELGIRPQAWTDYHPPPLKVIARSR
jgi:hypothetical protein